MKYKPIKYKKCNIRNLKKTILQIKKIGSGGNKNVKRT